jgi:hypothetical protein
VKRHRASDRTPSQACRSQGPNIATLINASMLDQEKIQELRSDQQASKPRSPRPECLVSAALQRNRQCRRAMSREHDADRCILELCGAHIVRLADFAQRASGPESFGATEQRKARLGAYGDVPSSGCVDSLGGD